jgi:type I restriction enzyme S subunit
MTALVTKHLPLVAGASDGIKQLRALILELAVRGKLVAHDAIGEPVEVLLSRTAAAKAELQLRGRVKVRKSPKDLTGGVPYAIPSGWKWCSLADLVEVLNGRAYKKEELLDQGTPVLRVGNLFTSNHWYFSNLELDSDRYCVPGDLLYAWSASFGPFIWSGERSIYHYHIWKLAPHINGDLNRRYLHDYLQAQTAAIKAAGHGVSMTHMTKEKMEQLPVPVPPLAEQHRIVAKVDELMALCDRLEADQADAEAVHAQLVQALLDSLTQATDAADFRASWQRLSEHFHTLFTTEASIDALKQTVLQLAVMGKLVPQSREDESASALLRQADVEKARLISEGVVRKARGSSAKEDVIYEPFSIPSGWLWVKKSSVLRFLNGYAFKSESFRSEGVRLLRNINVGHGVVDWSDVACLTEENADDFAAFALATGDLVLTLDRPIISTGLKAAVIRESDLPCLLLQRVAKLSPYADCVATGYLEIWLNSTFFIGAIDPGRSNGVPHISTSQVGEMLFALPPLAEQHRIVAKVDQLTALCDQLKALVSESRMQHAQLAEVLVERAVA